MPGMLEQLTQQGAGILSCPGIAKRRGKRGIPAEQGDVGRMFCSSIAFLVCVTFCDALLRTNDSVNVAAARYHCFKLDVDRRSRSTVGSVAF